MAEIFKFFNSAPGDERWHYASDFADYFANVLSSGLLHKNGTPNLQVRVVQGTLKTIVDTGEALMQGYQYQNTTELELTHNIPDTNLDRIDRIVLRLDKHNNARYIKLFVKEGVSAANPVPPALQRDNYVYELSLAQIRIARNTASLSPNNLTDERMNESLCGIVHSLISVPTSSFQQQWDYWFSVKRDAYSQDLNDWTAQQQSNFENWSTQERQTFLNWRTQEQQTFTNWAAQQESDFEDWVDTIRDILDTNVAGNLQLQIENHINARLPHRQTDSVTGKVYNTGWVIEGGRLYFEYEEVN